MPQPDPLQPDPHRPDPTQPATVEILDSTGALTPAALTWLHDQAAAALGLMHTTGELRARVVGDAEMSALHMRHTGIEGTTDVLTFDLRDTPPQPVDSVYGSNMFVIDTDIVVCLDEARRHAGPGGYPVEHELLLYLVHGVLHCIGHDDHAEDQALAMHAEEDRILRALGVGAVYSRGSGCADGSQRSGGTDSAHGGGTPG